jgi:rhodanese-related sulfurtransferase
MADTSLPPSPPQIPPEELAERLDRGESGQVLDVRAPEKVARGHVAFNRSRATRSRTLNLPDLSDLGRSHVPSRSSAATATQQTDHGVCASGARCPLVTGGMAAWETVYVACRLSLHLPHT